LAQQAYLYGYPLVANLRQVRRATTEGIGSVPAARFNTLSHGRALAGPKDTFVSINNDTLYSMAQVDLSVGPVRLTVPDTAGRYYVLQLIDAWTNNFAYIGHRGTGTSAGVFLLVPPGWSGASGDTGGQTVVRFPTRIGTVVGRWACTADDLGTVHRLQDATTLEPVDPSAVPSGLPAPDPATPGDLRFWEELRTWSQAFPPAPRDRKVQAGFSPLGITTTGGSPYADAPEGLAQALVRGEEVGTSFIEQLLETGAGGRMVNGWSLTYDVFDYNLDYFEVGTIDDPRYQIADDRRRLVTRAAAARGGLWGNHAYEAAYIATYVDDRGEPLTGEHTYRLRLHPTPPVGAFWSLTMYDLPDYFLVANELGRYSVGDRTAGLAADEDGGLTIVMSHERPADPKDAANWLPTPRGRFRPMIRMYEPAPEVLDGTYVVPPIVRD